MVEERTSTLVFGKTSITRRHHV